MEYFAISDAGPRPSNEDTARAWRLKDGSVGLAVADGLGGRGAGGKASTVAINFLNSAVLEFPQSTEALVSIFFEIHKEICSLQTESQEFRFMATTLTAVFLKGNSLLGAHVGDTRAAIARGRGIKKLTHDHSEAQRLLDEGKIDKDEFLNYPRKHILESALGASEWPRVDPVSFDLKEGDRVFVTSDGFHSKLPLRPMLASANLCSDPQLFAESASQIVRESHPDDNFSVAVSFI